MLKTRYEDYGELSASQPFVLHPQLQRSPDTFRAELNWHDNLEIQLCIAGQGIVLLDGVAHPIRVGDLVVVGCNVLHYTYTDTAMTYAALIVDAAFCRQMGLAYEDYAFSPVVRDAALEALFRQLIAVYSDPAVSLKVARQNALLLQMLVVLVSNHATVQGYPSAASRAPQTVKAALRYIHGHYAEKMSLEDIAGQVYVNKYVLSRAFRRFTGKTVVEYINRYRCQRAASLIASGSRVSEAAIACGFDNLSFFTKTFKAHMGILPSSLKRG